MVMFAIGLTAGANNGSGVTGARDGLARCDSRTATSAENEGTSWGSWQDVSQS
jgi:hypothetical protein